MRERGGERDSAQWNEREIYRYNFLLNKSGYEVGIHKPSYDNFTIIPKLDFRNLTRKVPIVLMILHS